MITQPRKEIVSMDENAYRQADGVANSDLKYAIPPFTMAHYKQNKDGQEKQPTPAQRFGSILHRGLLEPDTMNGNIAVKPEDMKFTTVAGKEWKAQQQGKTIMELEEKTQIQAMIESLYRHKIAKKLLEGSKKEACVFAHDSTGLLRKARLDLIPASGNALADVKTCESADLDSCNKAILNYGYHRQCYYYLKIMEIIGQPFENFILIFIEKSPPYLVACYPVDILSIEIGQKECEGALARIRACEEAGEWPGFPENLDTFVGLPLWSQAMKECA